MRRIACKTVGSEIKPHFIEVCDSCGKTMVDEDVNPDKYNFYRLTFGEISYDAGQDIRYRSDIRCNLDICEDCMNVIDSAVAATIRSLKNGDYHKEEEK